jgi:hypothetical protein
MQSFQNPLRSRRELTFSFDGLADREQMLFKSFVRLLDHRTQQTWSYRDGEADLMILGADAAKSPAVGQKAYLTLGAGSGSAGHCLSLPIHADELERELNLIGGLLVADTPKPSQAAEHVPLNGLVHLSRWPAPALLTSRDRIRLATLMTGRPMSLQQVASLSGVDHASCVTFVNALADSGFLESEEFSDTTPAPLTPASAVVSGGLLSRIRSRLGLGVH